MFGNPVPYHYVARAEELPTLTVVANNQQWLAVRQSTLDVFPDGHAAKANVMALTELKPSPDYEKVVETCGGRGEKVEGPKQLIPALERVARGRARRHAGDAQRADPGTEVAVGAVAGIAGDGCWRPSPLAAELIYSSSAAREMAEVGNIRLRLEGQGGGLHQDLARCPPQQAERERTEFAA